MSIGFRHIVRIVGTDSGGDEKLVYALSGIRGLGINLAFAVCRLAGVDPEQRVGFLTDPDIKRLEDVIHNPESYHISPWLLNKRRQLRSGEDDHFVGSDLVLSIKQDVEFLKKSRCYRGWRHSLGLKVRGQCTRTTGRTGQTVGVARKAAAAAAAAAAQQSQSAA